MRDLEKILPDDLAKSHVPYLYHLLRGLHGKYKRLVLPFAGNLAVAELAVKAGWPAAAVECSDVNLASHVMACHVNGRPVEGVDGHGDLNGLDYAYPELTLFALRLANARARAKNYFLELHARDLEQRAEAHVARILDGLERLKPTLAGFRYQTMDPLDHVAEAAADPAALIVVVPPLIKSERPKYLKVGHAITWAADPEYVYPDPKDFAADLRRAAAGKPALVVRTMRQRLEAGEEVEVVFADVSRVKKPGDKADMVLCNRPEECFAVFPKTALPRRRVDIAPIDAPILSDAYAFTEASQIAFIRVSKENALYYRDLWAHRLGRTDSEFHYVMLVDGYVCGVCGLFTQAVRVGQPTVDGKVWVEETYGFTAPSRRYPRLNRLLMMAITSKAFYRFLYGTTPRRPPVEPAGLVTTCLARHTELKTNRGILKLYAREWREDEQIYHLRYKAEWRDDTFPEVMAKWLTNHGLEKYSTLDRVLNSGSATSTT